MLVVKKALYIVAIFIASVLYILHPIIRALSILWMYTYSVYKNFCIKGAACGVIFRPRVRVFGVNNIIIHKGVVINIQRCIL